MVARRALGLVVLGLCAACSETTYVTPPAFTLPIVGSELANPLTTTVSESGAVFDAGGERLLSYDVASGVTSTVQIAWPDDFTLVDLSAHTRMDSVVEAVALGYSRGQLQTLVARFDPLASSGDALSAMEVTRIAGWSALRAVHGDLLIVAGAEFVGTQFGGVEIPAPHWLPLGVRATSAVVEVYGLVDTQPVGYSIDLSTYSVAGPTDMTWSVEGALWRTRSDPLYADPGLQISSDWFVLEGATPMVPAQDVTRPVWRGSDSQLTLRVVQNAGAVTSVLELGQSVVAATPAGRQAAAPPVWVALADGALVRLVATDARYTVARANRRAAQTTVPQLDDQPPYSNPTLNLESLGSGNGRYFLPSQTIAVAYEQALASFVPVAGFPAGVSVAGAWSAVLRPGDSLQRADQSYAVTAVTHGAVWLDRPWPGGKPGSIRAPGRYVVYGTLSGLFGTVAPGESLEFGGVRLRPTAGADAVNAGDRFTFGYETQLRPFRGTGALSVVGWDLKADRVWTLDRAGGSLAGWRPSDGDSDWVIE